MHLKSALTLIATMTLSAQLAQASGLPEIPFEKYTLPNGLQVILHEDHSTPIVTVNLWYHVGSKNEQPGRTGFAHLFEHMMFQGTKHHDGDYFSPLQQAGAKLNGSTSQDRTNYWATVPSNYLELAIWMESDRMGFLLPAMTQEKLDNQREVVKNERRQSYENRPYGLAYETLLAAMYPADHPYSWPTIGSMADINRATREDVANFFRRYYHPGNASLCIAGDFTPAEAKRLVEQYFGAIPAGPEVKKLPPQPVQLTEEKRIAMTDRVGLSRLYLAWPTVASFSTDEAELDVLADVLAGGKTSWLDQILVRDKQIAQEVSVSQSSDELAGAMLMVATAKPGHSLAEIDQVVLEQIERMKTQGPTAEEVARAVNRFEAQLVRSLESASGFSGRADRLNLYNVLTGDPGYLQKDFDRYLRVTPEGVKRVAEKYLGKGRVVLEITPGKETAVTPDPRAAAEQARDKMAESVKVVAVPAGSAISEDDARKNLPQPAPLPKFNLPPIERMKLANGMEVLLVERHELPTVAMNLVMRTGRCEDPCDKLGLVNLLTSVWDEGTASRTSEQIADELAGIGATLSLSADWDATSARLFTLTRHLPKALEIYADVLRNPSFPEREVAREKALALGRLVQIRDDASSLAQLAVAAAIYGDAHPYGRSPVGTPATLRAITRDDIEAFYKDKVFPEQATLIVVGDVAKKDLLAQLDKSLGDWKSTGAKAADAALPAVPAPKPTHIVLVDKPGAPQSVIACSQIGVERKSPDYAALTVMNSIFGGQFSSRLNLNLREDKGYTYGARTMFDWRVGQPGPFLATSSVQTAVTAPALVEFLKEYDGMLGARPVGEAELEFSKAYLTRGYPADFETPAQIARQLETLVEYGLGDDYFNTYIPKIMAVTSDDVLRVAKKYLDRDHLALVIVADRAKVQESLRDLPVGKDLEIVGFDEDFHLTPEK